ncbi:MAG: rhomboid family intramembrane serine protease [Verrucomicrobia bacterium]|nr:rhomboid family intramembrane serine protease [Verrucomicrobiota bacterium]
MRTPSFKPQRSVTVALIVINAAIFVLQQIVGFYYPFLFRQYAEVFALSINGLSHGYLWQFFTFQFMHGGEWHLIGNLLAIYFFGRPMEDALGRGGMLKLYFTSGVVGGLLQIVFAWMVPKYFGGPVVGASAGAFGLVAAFATMFPEREIVLIPFPVSIRARVLLWFAIGLAVMGIIVPSQVADAAHLGGILTGILFVYWVAQGIRWHFTWPSFRSPTRRPRELVRASVPKRSLWQRGKTTEEEDLTATEFISREVDPILDKISAHGIQSLTERERKILEAARAKMAKR